MPELRIKTESWTRESHGLYDFEGTEVERSAFRLRGSQALIRNESSVRAQTVEGESLEEGDQGLAEEDRDKIIARFQYHDNSYWVYQK